MVDPCTELALAIIEAAIVDLARSCRCGQTDRYGRALVCHRHNIIADMRRDGDLLDGWYALLGYDPALRLAIHQRLAQAADDRAVAQAMVTALMKPARAREYDSDYHDAERPDLCEVA